MMRKSDPVIGWLIAAAVAVWLSPAVAQMGLMGAGSSKPRGGAPAGFTGVGDVVSGAKMHWGTIAYSAATRGQPMLSLCDSGGNNCSDALSDATTGIVSSTQVRNSVSCGSTVGTNACRIGTFYDDSGALQCSGAACDLGGTAPAFMAYFIPNASGTVPGIRCAAASSAAVGTASNTPHIAQPASLLAAYATKDNPTPFGLFMDDGVSAFLYTLNGPNMTTNFTNSGSGVSTGTVTVDTIYAVIATQAAAGGNGSISLNGTTTTGTVGTTGFTAGSIKLCDAVLFGGENTNALSLEVAIYGADLSSNVAALTSAMRTNGGY